MVNQLPTEVNSSFSRSVPGLQTCIDSTSLGEFKQCPRKYQYSILLGFQPAGGSPHLTFGIMMHQARERYDLQRFEGASHEEALDWVFDKALRETWDPHLGRPIALDHPVKNRGSLLRTIVWYLDKYGELDSIKTLVLADGRPAVELPFHFDSRLRFSSTKEPVIFCGHLDRIGTLGGEAWVVDLKTTQSALTPHWFKSFTPDNQFSFYTFSGQVAFKVPIAGLILDGIQLGVGFSRFARHPISRDRETLQEFYQSTGHWIARMEECVLEDFWPQNDKACGLYGGCQFREICSRSPSQRLPWMEKTFAKRGWDPMKGRTS
jgi:hypothetical protein